MAAHKLSFVGALWRYRFLRATPLVGKQYTGLLPTVKTNPLLMANTVCRSVSFSGSLRSDIPPRKDENAEKLDLDIWKSVMRSQASQAPKQEDGEDVMTPGEESESCPLKASRELVEMWHYAGKMVPENITDDQLKTFAEMDTKSAKKKYLKFLAIKEGHKKKRQRKKEMRKAQIEEETERRDSDMDEEVVGETKLRNTFMIQFWSRSLDKVIGWRGVQAMRFGQPLVFDMSYSQLMSMQEMRNTVSQLLEAEGWNRRSVDPFHLHFCNLQPDGQYHRELLQRYGAESWERLLITTTPQQHIDLFPHRDLVYLTANSPNVLHTFDHSKVYIIGAMVDRSIQSGVSLAHAKRLKLATARLPLDEYLQWDCGAKNLTLDQMIRIMTTVKETGSWEEALKFVPQRKHDGFYKERRMNEQPGSTWGVEDQRPSKRGQGRERDRPFVSQQQSPISSYVSSVPSKAATRVVNNLNIPSRLGGSVRAKLPERSRTVRSKKWWEE